MRYSDVVRRARPAFFGPPEEILFVGPKHLEQLRDLAASAVASAEERQQRAASGWLPPSAQVAYDKKYAEGVTAILDWVLTGTPSTELRELLELEA